MISWKRKWTNCLLQPYCIHCIVNYFMILIRGYIYQANIGSFLLSVVWKSVKYEKAHILSLSYWQLQCKNIKIYNCMQHNSLLSVSLCPLSLSACFTSLFCYWIIVAAASFVWAESGSERVLTFPILFLLFIITSSLLPSSSSSAIASLYGV